MAKTPASWNSSYWSGDPVEFPATSYLKYIEILHYPDDDGIINSRNHFEGNLNDDSLPRWFNRDLSISASNGDEVKPTGGLRLLLGILDCSTPDTVLSPVSKTSAELVYSNIPTPPNYYAKTQASNEPRVFIYTPSGASDLADSLSGLGFTFHSDGRGSHNPFVLILHHNKATNVTLGFLQVKRSLVDLAPALQTLRTEPFRHECVFLPLLLIDLELENRNNSFLESDLKLDDLEEQMGQHETLSRPKGDSTAVDFGAAMRRINKVTKCVALDKACVTCLLCGLETLERWMEEVGGEQNKSLGNKLKFARDTCTLIFSKIECMEKRAGMLIQVIHQSISQKDAKINIELLESSALIARASKEDSAVMRQIAIETKKDNASMKTIAILGMFFLPGTFVATIFTMPMFDAELRLRASNGSGFALYWAITVPITTMVLVCWALATLVPWQKKDWTGSQGLQCLVFDARKFRSV